MASTKHAMSASASPAPGAKRAKSGSTATRSSSSHVKGVTFKFRLRESVHNFEWLKDVSVVAFQTPSGQPDELILDVKLKKEKKRPSAASIIAKMRKEMGLGGAGDDNDEPDDDDEDEDESLHEFDPYAEEDDEDEDEGCGVRLGSVGGRIMRRSFIRPNFWRDMEEPSEDTAALAFNLFDRYGCVRPEFITGSRKGSGTFGHELDTGDILLIEMIQVEKEHRRHNIGSSMLEIFLEQCSKAQTTLEHALAWPTAINYNIPDNLPDAEKQKLWKEANDIAVAFFRKAAFRRVGDSVWFALPFDKTHTAYTLTAAKDYDVAEPAPLPSELEKLERALERKRTKHDHLMMTIVVSDQFKGYSDADVKKLLELRGVTAPALKQQACAKYGCTCGDCLGGFLSPRMRASMKMTCEWENDNEMNDEDYVWKEAEQYGDQGMSSIASWPYLPAVIKPFMKSNKNYRIGHRLLHGHIITCLDKGVVPNAQNILEAIEEASEWPPATKNFLQKAGLAGIEAVMRAVCDRMKETDLKTGGGIDAIAEHDKRTAQEERYKAEGKDPATELGMDRADWAFRNMGYDTDSILWTEMLKEKECRNDSEFGFLLGMILNKTITSEYWN